MPLGVTQGRLGYVKIGSLVVPAANFAAPAPRNLATQHPIGRDYATLHGEGFQTSTLTCSLLLRDTAGECLSSAFLNHFFARASNDTAAITLIACDGKEKMTFANAKAESLAFSVAKGQQQLMMNVAFVCPTKPTYAAADADTVDASAPLTFKSVSFTGLSAAVYGFEMTYTNNHIPDAPITADGGANIDVGAAWWDAGIRQAGCTFRFRAWSGSAPIADEQEVSMVLSGSGGKQITFTFPALVPADPHSRGADLGQVYRTLPCIAKGTAAAGPLGFAQGATTF